MNINEFLVRHFHISKEVAGKMLQEKRIRINEEKAVQRQNVLKTDFVEADGEILQQGVQHSYYAFYKPRGIECTLNPQIENNLRAILPFEEHLYPVGRLDKESEGLLLLTNNGKLYKNIAFSDNVKEKEYMVEVDKELTDTAIQQLASGIVIMGKKTRPAQVTRASSQSFRIVLTQGLNRQIRRMCYKLDLNVTLLKRVRITSVLLGDLKPGEYRKLGENEISN